MSPNVLLGIYTSLCHHIIFMWVECSDPILVSKIQKKTWDSEILLLKDCVSILLTISTRGTFIQEKLLNLCKNTKL